MNSIKTLLVLAALSVTSVAMAEGGADRTFARMEQAREISMHAYQATQQQADNTAAISHAEHTEHTNAAKY